MASHHFQLTPPAPNREGPPALTSWIKLSRCDLMMASANPAMRPGHDNTIANTLKNYIPFGNLLAARILEMDEYNDI